VIGTSKSNMRERDACWERRDVGEKRMIVAEKRKTERRTHKNMSKEKKKKRFIYLVAGRIVLT
jgi:hypothetical protein